MKRPSYITCGLLAFTLVSTPVFAQQPLQQSVEQHARLAAATSSATTQPSSGRSTKFWTGAILTAAGGTAIILGTTTLQTEDTTSGNTPPQTFAECEALKANPVYRGNQCDVLKGPNIGVVVAGALAAAAGATLMMLGTPRNSVQVGPGGFIVRHRVTF
jgi:hypothetical protein